MRSPPSSELRWLVAAFAALLLVGCAEIPKDGYGVARLRLRGVEEVDRAALRACLATRERDQFGPDLGLATDPTCGEPPFDARRLQARWWPWPWTDWPSYDLAVLERDLARIERWYEARGYYQARVVSATFDPPAAATTDRVEGRDGELVCEPEAADEGCRLEIVISIEEGEPVLVESISVAGTGGLSDGLRRRIESAVELEVGEPFDEAIYDRSKRAVGDVLRNRTFACASVTGEVTLDPEARAAVVELKVDPGRAARIGDIEVQGNGDLPARTILGAALLRRDQPYRPDDIAAAQRAIYALGALSAVDIVGEPRRVEGPDGEPVCTGVVDVTIGVTPGRQLRYGVGAGVQTGESQLAAADSTSPRQWDIHLLAFVEHRNLFGGFRRLRLEERPRLIFQSQFPGVDDPSPGNIVSLAFRQPAFIEPRTSLLLNGTWDFGPDPNEGFTRHDFEASLGVERAFFDGRIVANVAVHENLLRLPDGATSGTSPYDLMFLSQYIQLDLRDRIQQPRKGAFFGLSLQEGGFFMPASWSYLRVAPEARGYIPLPVGMVLAARFSLGAMFIKSADTQLDAVSAALGPNRYRVRGGGPTGNRGFIAGQLGDGPGGDPTMDLSFSANSGGLRKWEASLELRVRLSESFGLVFFTDMGDVNRDDSFRFDHLNTAVGGGIRYLTSVGAFRIDMAGLVPGGRIVGEADPAPFHELDLLFTRFPGAIHLTIGEAF